MNCRLKAFLWDERGDSVTWIVLIIIGVVIAVSAYLKFKGTPGSVGAGVQTSGNNAAEGVNQIQIQ